MSDLSDLHGIFPNSLRWNAETGILTVSAYNPETGEREQKPIEFGQRAMFVLDAATRERGYGRIRVGEYSMLLSPVGADPPPWPGAGSEYKPAIGCWAWSPSTGEVRLETCSAMFRDAVANIFHEANSEPQAREGQQPVVSFVNRAPVVIKALRKTIYSPVIERVGFVERDKIPGWKERAPTVPLPVAAPALAKPTAPAPVKEIEARRHKAKQPPKAKNGDPPVDPNLNDDVPPFDE
jgi:hypothetical protein